MGGNLNPSPLSELPGWVVGKATEVSGTWPAKLPMGLGSRGQAGDLGCCVLERAALDHPRGHTVLGLTAGSSPTPCSLRGGSTTRPSSGPALSPQKMAPFLLRPPGCVGQLLPGETLEPAACTPQRRGSFELADAQLAELMGSAHSLGPRAGSRVQATPRALAGSVAEPHLRPAGCLQSRPRHVGSVA